MASLNVNIGYESMYPDEDAVFGDVAPIVDEYDAAPLWKKTLRFVLGCVAIASAVAIILGVFWGFNWIYANFLGTWVLEYPAATCVLLYFFFSGCLFLYVWKRG